MDLASHSETLTCAECDTEIEDAGYLPATERDGTYHPLVDAAVCDTCGFNDIGMTGCAPDLGDVVDSGPDDTLLYVRLTDDGIEVVSAKG